MESIELVALSRYEFIYFMNHKNQYNILNNIVFLKLNKNDISL